MVHTSLIFFYHSDHLCYHSFLHMGFNLHPLCFQVGLEALPSLLPYVPPSLPMCVVCSCMHVRLMAMDSIFVY